MAKEKTNTVLTLIGITEELYRTNVRLNQVLTNALKNNTNTKSIEVHTELISKAITDLSEKFEILKNTPIEIPLVKEERPPKPLAATPQSVPTKKKPKPKVKAKVKTKPKKAVKKKVIAKKKPKGFGKFKGIGK